MANAQTINVARNNYRAAVAAVELLSAEIASEFPEPTEDAAWEIWCDKTEDAHCDRGGFDLQDAKAAALDAVLVSVRDAIADRTPASVMFVWEAAIAGTSYSARKKMLDSCMRLDTRTV